MPGPDFVRISQDNRPPHQWMPGAKGNGNHGHDADHGVQLSAELHHLPQDGGIRTVGVAPKGIAKEDGVLIVCSYPPLSAASLKPRPSAGRTPSIGNKLALIRGAFTWVAPLLPSRK